MNEGLELDHLPGLHDPFSALSHLAGAALFLVLGVLLLRRGRGDPARLPFLGVYAVSCVLLFTMSGVYHMMQTGGTARLVMQRLDHGAIFVLIAGSFTPAHGILFRGVLRWLPLAVVWTAAAAGIALKTIYFDDMEGWLGLSLYLALGWLGAISGTLLARRYGFAFIKPALLGGLAYTLGGVVDSVDWPVVVPGVIHPHEVFHVAVLVGAWFHWLFTWQFAAGPPAARAEEALADGKDLVQ